MSWLDNHHMVVTLLIAAFVLGFGLAGLYLAYRSHNPTALAAAIAAVPTSLTGLHAGVSAVANSTSNTAYNVPPGLPPTPPPSAFGGPHA